jgi:hypothetical protein
MTPDKDRKEERKAAMTKEFCQSQIEMARRLRLMAERAGNKAAAAFERRNEEFWQVRLTVAK